MAEKTSVQAAASAEKTHTLQLTGRTSLSVTGVLSLDDYSETSVTAKTVCGVLNVEGEGLCVRRLTPEEGILAVDGSIHTLYYAQERAGSGEKSIFARLFR